MGTAVAGLGMVEVFAQTSFVPQQWQFQRYGWVMIVIGIALTIPFVSGLITQARAVSRATSGR